MKPLSPPPTLHAILNFAPQAKMEKIEDGHRREASITHPNRNRGNVAEAAARFAQFQNANETPKNAAGGNRGNVVEAATRFAQLCKNPAEERAVGGNREKVVEAAARFAQFQNANETPKNPAEERAVEGNRENVVEAAARFAQSQNANETPKNPEEEHAVGEKDDNPDFCESVSREFAGGAKQEREDEERMMECLKKWNDSLDEIATACEIVGQLLERFEKTITSFEQRIERMHWKSAAADATADADVDADAVNADASATADADVTAPADAIVAADATAPADATATAAGSSSGTGSGGGKTPLASVNDSHAEQGDSPKRFWSEEVVESDSIWNEVGGGEREGAFNIRDLSVDEQYRTVRESAPSPEPRRCYFDLTINLPDTIRRPDYTNDKRPRRERRFPPSGRNRAGGC